MTEMKNVEWINNRMHLNLRASNGSRTRDIQSHNLTLYLLSYTRHMNQFNEFLILFQ